MRDLHLVPTLLPLSPIFTIILSLVSPSILLVSPPFTQLNTPYPAIAYLKGFLNTKGIISHQVDLSIETTLQLFTRKGLQSIFDISSEEIHSFPKNIQRIYALKETYLETIEPVIAFLQDDDPTLAYLISTRQFLPEASKFEQLDDLEWAFGTMGIRDHARHLATLYLEDLGDFIREVVDPHFGFSRYAERLAMSASSFDDLYTALHEPDSFIVHTMLELLDQHIRSHQPDLVCLSVPFPGNLFAALKCGQFIKKHYPAIRIGMGGGYPNTELRTLAEPRVFEFVDFISLDDGEATLFSILSFMSSPQDIHLLKRTFILHEGTVRYCNDSLLPDVKQDQTGTPDYAGLPLKKYLSVIQLINPMHRLWSDGRWNKLTMAHGCYWGKCTFCDISLDYIKNYEASTATVIVDRMETLIEQTGERGFHFVDEAAPPALMKAVALEILRRKLVVTWWTNIRFEKSFHYDLCRLLAASGCIAVSGGLEVASDRLLELIAKGVTVEQVSKVNENFNRAGIMVHAYLMYGFPTQTAQETIDSLEVVRQMFEQGVPRSAFWHRFAMTAHSPVGLEPAAFHVEAIHPDPGLFAHNDLVHEDPSGTDHVLFSAGLAKSLYNYMHGVCLDHPLQSWFEHKVPATTIPADLIASYLHRPAMREAKPANQVVWLGGPVHYNPNESALQLSTLQTTVDISCPPAIGQWLEKVLTNLCPDAPSSYTYAKLRDEYVAAGFDDFTLFWFGSLMERMKEEGLVVL